MSFIIEKGVYTTTIDSTTLTNNRQITFPDTSGTVMVLRSGNFLDTFYPVGTIYMTANANFNPNTSWGGTWVKIENRFLLGSGTKSVGTTGGEETHKLTTNEIPAHTHGVGTLTATGTFTVGGDKNDAPDYIDNSTGVFSTYTYGEPFNVYNKDHGDNALSKKDIDFWFHRKSEGNTDWYGGQDAHNNMPPFLVVNIWKRTA